MDFSRGSSTCVGGYSNLLVIKRNIDPSDKQGIVLFDDHWDGHLSRWTTSTHPSKQSPPPLPRVSR
jgi:hypothetical protein